MQYILDKNRKRVKHCPCGKSNLDGKFVPFVGFETAGYCHGCGEHVLPDESDRFQPAAAAKFSNAFSTIPVELMEKGIGKKPNAYIHYLEQRFGVELARELVDRYLIGTSTYKPGCVIFWQVDHKYKIRSGRIVLYDALTGKRVQHPAPVNTWVHTQLLAQGLYTSFELCQCLFGQHLLSDSVFTDKTVAIVEGESTAIEMSHHLPDFLWLATGGCHAHQLTQPDTLKVLRKRKVVLFPDGGFYDKWNVKCKEMIKKGVNTGISETLETYYRREPEKYWNADLRDVYAR